MKPIASQSHLEAAFRYVLRQDTHHGLDVDTLHVASALPDLLGLRRTCPALGWRAREHLPRLQRTDLLELLGVPSLTETVDGAHLRAAALGLFALDRPGNDTMSVRARRAAITAAAPLGPTTIAAALGVTREAVSRAPGADTLDVRAVGRSSRTTRGARESG